MSHFCTLFDRLRKHGPRNSGPFGKCSFTFLHLFDRLRKDFPCNLRPIWKKIGDETLPQLFRLDPRTGWKCIGNVRLLKRMSRQSLPETVSVCVFPKALESRPVELIDAAAHGDVRMIPHAVPGAFILEAEENAVFWMGVRGENGEVALS